MNVGAVQEIKKNFKMNKIGQRNAKFFESLCII